STQESFRRPAISSLEGKFSERGGVNVPGWSRDEYAITVCLAATGDTSNDAKTVLDQLKLSVQDGQVGVTGPPSRDWIAFLIIQAANGGVLGLDSDNGANCGGERVGSGRGQKLTGQVSFDRSSVQLHAGEYHGPITG